MHATVFEQIGQHAMGNSGPHLAFDVIADNGQAALGEAIGPILGAGDEDGDGVHKGATRFQNLLHIPFGGHFGANGQVADDDIRFGFFEDADDIGRGTPRFFDHRADIFAQPVMGHAPVDSYVHVRDFGEFNGVVGVCPDGFAQIFADFAFDNIESGRELNIANVVAAKVDVHQPRYFVVFIGIAVIMDTLHQRIGTVAYANNGDTYFV